MNFLYGLALTAHLGLSADYNSLHPHIRVLHHNGAISGVYLNSEDRLSTYVGMKFDHNDTFIEVGIVSGYTAVGRPVLYGRAGRYLNNASTVFIAPAVEVIDSDVTKGLVLCIEFMLR